MWIRKPARNPNTLLKKPGDGLEPARNPVNAESRTTNYKQTSVKKAPTCRPSHTEKEVSTLSSWGGRKLPTSCCAIAVVTLLSPDCQASRKATLMRFAPKQCKQSKRSVPAILQFAQIGLRDPPNSCKALAVALASDCLPCLKDHVGGLGTHHSSCLLRQAVCQVQLDITPSLNHESFLQKPTPTEPLKHLISVMQTQP